MKQDYSTRARKLAYSFPRLSFIGIQVNFWILAIFLFSFISYMNTSYLGEIHQIDFPVSFHAVIITSISVGIILGIALSLIDLLLIRTGIQNLSFGKVLLLKILTYLLVVFMILAFIKFFLLDFMSLLIETDYSVFFESDITWHYFFWSLLVYIIFMSAVLSFINQMNYMFGPGVLIPLLMGKFRNPKEQERFFMFLDLRSSTKHAEELGHLEYSTMIRDCFMDLNRVLTRNNAEIYQYVGDEAVITWPAEEGIDKLACLSLFFDFEKELEKRREYYLKTYRVFPEFKAGLHFGVITTVEVGQIKREIAYHGDTINTAARIQSLCNEYGANFLVSESVISILPELAHTYDYRSLGEISLKGKTNAIEIFLLQSRTITG